MFAGDRKEGICDEQNHLPAQAADEAPEEAHLPEALAFLGFTIGDAEQTTAPTQALRRLEK
jgi:hypothetical protein